MKLTTLLLTVFCLQVSASAFSQKVSISVKNTSIEKVLLEIRAQSGYAFFYNARYLKNAEPVTMQVKDGSVEQALTSCFQGQPFTYEVVGSTIVIKPKIRSENIRASVPVPFPITGKVTDEKNEPLVGVSVKAKGSSVATLTNLNGEYVIQAPEGSTLLVFSSMGYSSQEVSIKGENTINVILSALNQSLEEIVVVGYGSVKKSDLTGAVASVKVDELNQGVLTSVDQLLNGVSGANVVQNSGEPGGSFSINIRGASSVSAGNDPLYVVDGFPVNNNPAVGSGSISGFSGSRSPTNPLSSINPQDIASIEILKDASAAAIYGSRGANGVVLITTKKGKIGSLKTELHSSIGLQRVFNSINLLSAKDYKRVLNEIIDEGGENLDVVGDIANGGFGTDWQKELVRDQALVQNHQLSFSGGTEKTKYFVSLNSTNQEGVVKLSGFNRYSMRLNLESKLSERFTLGVNSTSSYSENTYIPNGFGTNEDGGAFYAAINFDPTLGILDDNGEYIISPFLSIDNPMALMKGTSSSSKSNRTLASITGEYKITSDLLAKVNIGGDVVNEKRKNYISRATKNGRNSGGIGSNQQGDLSSYLVEGTLNYSKVSGDHSVNALAGASYQRFSSSKINIRANDFPSDALHADNLSLGSQETYVISNPTTGNRLASLIGRIDYAYKDKYSTTLTVRRDGSSRFGANHKYGVFPSAALAWKISEEDFFKNVGSINFLKLRTSWGLTGNQEIGDFAYQTTYTSGSSAIWDEKAVTATAPARLPNPDLKWEQTQQINVGLDFALFNNRINGAMDYFSKSTTDMLLNLPVPQSTGFGSILTNIGQIDNSGFEFSVNSKNIETPSFQWSTDVSFTTLKNKVKSLGNIPRINSGSGFLHVDQIGIIRPGDALNSFYGWQVAGVWQQDDDYSLSKDNVAPGDLKYVDQNGDGFVNGDDRVVLGNSFPDFQWSFGNSFRYKNFDLFAFFDGVEGAKMLNGNLIESYFPINFRRNKVAEPYLNRWTPENPSDVYPSFVNPLSQGRKTVNSLTVKDASYVRLKSVRLTYNLVKKIAFIHSTQFYVTAENLFVLTDYDGIDPTINPNNNASLRVDFNSYPTAKTYILGIKMTL